jgi:hypothetical protein
MARSTVLDKLKAGTLKLSVGSHVPNGEACVMEAESQYLGEEWTDHPSGVDPSIAAYCRVLNDISPQWVRDELMNRIPSLAKAKKLPPSAPFEWAEAARQSAIRALGQRGKALAACAPITDKATAMAAAYSADAAIAAAYSADAAAAAYSADAAIVAAYSADAAIPAAYSAGASAAASAVAAEWKEALKVLDRMIAEASK